MDGSRNGQLGSSDNVVNVAGNKRAKIRPNARFWVWEGIRQARPSQTELASKRFAGILQNTIIQYSRELSRKQISQNYPISCDPSWGEGDKAGGRFSRMRKNLGKNWGLILQYP